MAPRPGVVAFVIAAAVIGTGRCKIGCELDGRHLEERNDMDRAAMISSLLLTAAALVAALPAAAQTPRMEVSGGYQFLNVSAGLESIDTGDVPVRNVDQSLPAGWAC
jgi:hypothetical protein